MYEVNYQSIIVPCSEALNNHLVSAALNNCGWELVQAFIKFIEVKPTSDISSNENNSSFNENLSLKDSQGNRSSQGKTDKLSDHVSEKGNKNSVEKCCIFID